MRIYQIMPLAAGAMLAMATTFSLAQGTQNPPATSLEKPAVAQDSSGSGTAPEGKGSTGWTGGSRNPAETTGQSAGRTDPEAAANQPLMATGLDLNGPAKRFPANQTPE